MPTSTQRCTSVVAKAGSFDVHETEEFQFQFEVLVLASICHTCYTRVKHAGRLLLLLSG